MLARLKPVPATPEPRDEGDRGASGGAETGKGPSGADVARLVARASEGDVAAFQTLIAAYSPQVHRFALGFAASRDEAHDLSQEALIKVYRSIGSFRFQSSFSTWLYSIVRNVFLDAYKSRASRERALEKPLDEQYGAQAEAAMAPHAEERLLREGERQALHAALRRVPPVYRQVVLLFDVQGLSYDEIARALAVPVGTVKSRLKRGRDALRTELFRTRARER